MKPVAIFRHTRTEGPGYCATFLSEHSIAWRMIQIDAGDVPPKDVSGLSGLVFMGGPMSVNDDLPWIPPVLSLIRSAVQENIPVLGHCLGGQLIAKALGATVGKNPVWEIGWGEVQVEDNPVARQWLGELTSFDSFHWHGETFSLPAGAAKLLSSPHCANQAFALGPHLGLQCHVEMTADMVNSWCDSGEDDIAAHPGPAVQQVQEMRRNLRSRVTALNRVGRKLYRYWIKGLAR